jgi:hypothetical protein
MSLRALVIGTLLIVLASPAGGAFAQGRRHGMGRQDGMSHTSGALQQMEPVLQPMGGLMQQMAERIKAGPMTPEQTLHLSMLVEQLAGMISKLGSGTLGSDTATQLEGMRTRLTEMQKELAPLMSVPSAKP